jgi:hypothetical protein
VFAGVPNVLAATYDLIIKGGRVIDPSVGLDAVRDVAIAVGRVAACRSTKRSPVRPRNAARVFPAFADRGTLNIVAAM